MRPGHAASRQLASAALAMGVLLAACDGAAAGVVSEFPPGATGPRLAVIVTGDDGATSMIRALARHLATDGLPSVVLSPTDSLVSPGATSAAIERVVRAHMAQWHRERIVVVGVARGASMAPFVANRLSSDLRSRVDAVIMREPRPRVSLRRRWRVPWRSGARPTDIPLLPELERMRGTPLLCLYRAGERDAFCPSLDGTLAQREVDPAPGDDERAGALLARRVLAFSR